MTKESLLNAIYSTLEQELNIPQIHAFHQHARLNEDLYLDSVLLMELMVNLELKLNIEIPDNSLNKNDFETVNSLINFFLTQTDSNQNDHVNTLENSEKTVEEFEDIKVHCFVSCICEIIKADERVDHRPFYFGVWDAEIIINDQGCLDYHSQNINHDFFIEWYQKLYGVPITAWYKPEVSKINNINTLVELLANKTTDQQIMVMLDMYRLPERENKFSHNPFPHYVLLEETTDTNVWNMSDPDFRWEGLQKKQQVIHAIESEAVAGGYCFDRQNIKETRNQDIHDYFLACFNEDRNRLTDSVKHVIDLHLSTPLKASANLGPENLDTAMKQLPVLAIRKYAYEHGLAFFWRANQLDDTEFESWCDVIEELVDTYKKIQYRAIKIANLYREKFSINQQLLTEIYELLDQQDTSEFQIKARLFDAFQQWRQCELLSDNGNNDPLLKVSA